MVPNQYSYDYGDNKIEASLGFEGESTSKITLRATFMQDQDVFFDRKNQKIGFAVAECNIAIIINNNYKEKEDNNLKKDKI